MQTIHKILKLRNQITCARHNEVIVSTRFCLNTAVNAWEVQNWESCYLTEGSKKADKPVSPLARAKRKETMAAAINIFTSKSSNCFSTSRQKGVPAISNNHNNVRNHYPILVLKHKALYDFRSDYNKLSEEEMTYKTRGTSALRFWK